MKKLSILLLLIFPIFLLGNTENYNDFEKNEVNSLDNLEMSNNEKSMIIFPKIDHCTSNPCQHGGICKNKATSYTCDCKNTGYTGKNCELLDSDNDSIADIYEKDSEGKEINTDDDKIPNHLDDDDDNDGVKTRDENPDKNGDGNPDDAQKTTTNKPDYLNEDDDGDGIFTKYEVGSDPSKPIDTDGDGIPDYLDTDDDNDGFNTIIEHLCKLGNPKDAKDTNSDGIPDYLDANFTPCKPNNPCKNDGICEPHDNGSSIVCECKEEYSGATCETDKRIWCNVSPAIISKNLKEVTEVKSEIHVENLTINNVKLDNLKVEFGYISNDNFTDINSISNWIDADFSGTGFGATKENHLYKTIIPNNIIEGNYTYTYRVGFKKSNPDEIKWVYCDSDGNDNKDDDDKLCPKKESECKLELDKLGSATINNPCNPNPCKNDSICTDRPDGYFCTCKKGYEGKNCEAKTDTDKDGVPDIDEDLNKDGDFDNDDTDKDGIPNYKDDDDDNDDVKTKDELGDDVNNPRDTDKDGKPDYLDDNDDDDEYITKDELGDLNKNNVPDYLEKDVNECEEGSNPCKNDSICKNTNGSYECACKKGYEGKNCEIKTDTDKDGIPDVDEDINKDGNFDNDDSDKDGIPDYLDPEDNSPNASNSQTELGGEYLGSDIASCSYSSNFSSSSNMFIIMALISLLFIFRKKQAKN